MGIGGSATQDEKDEDDKSDGMAMPKESMANVVTLTRAEIDDIISLR